MGVALHSFEGERDAKFATNLGHLEVELGTAGIAKLGGSVAPALHARKGHIRVELERAPGKPDAPRQAGADFGERRFEPALAYIAPRADHVRVHGNCDRVDHAHRPVGCCAILRRTPPTEQEWRRIEGNVLA